MEPAEVFARLTDWERHGEAVPLTRIRRTESGFVARTGVGPLGFDDVMDVVAWDPPRSCRIEKRGRVVKGTVGVPRFAARLEEAAGRRLFGRVVDHLLRT